MLEGYQLPNILVFGLFTSKIWCFLTNSEFIMYGSTWLFRRPLCFVKSFIEVLDSMAHNLNFFTWKLPQFFRKFHAAYVDAVSNPFHIPGKKITSKTFRERVSSIVKSFGLSSASWILMSSDARPRPKTTMLLHIHVFNYVSLPELLSPIFVDRTLQLWM